MTKKYFGTDGIRGTVNKGNINGEMFFKFGLAAGTFFKNQKKTKQTAIIAKDTRLSGYTLEPALVSGLASAGMHVFTLGPLPTNGLAMLTKSMKANMGIMITASHNPYYDNGLKLFGPDGAFFRCGAWPLRDLADPTGAGDTFLGGLIGTLAAEGAVSPTFAQLKTAVVNGSILASFTCENFSTKSLESAGEADFFERIDQFQQISAW